VKLEPQFYGPLEILERIGPMTYRLTLPMTMKVHDDFQVSFLKRNIKDVDHIIDCYVLDVDPNGEF